MKNFARFDDVENTLARAFNRVVMANNIVSEFGADKSREYIGGFNRNSQLEMATVVGMIKNKGLKQVKMEVADAG